MRLKALVFLGTTLFLGAYPLWALASTSVFFPNNNTTQTGTVVGGRNAADVNIAGGSISVTNPSIGTNGATSPTSSTLSGGKDGSGNLQPLKVDTSGNLSTSRTWTLLNSSDSVNAVESGSWNITNISGTVSLPTGASTEATLSALNTKVTAVNTGAVVISSSALPSGASTSALQTTGNTSLSSIDGKLHALGQNTMANSMPVTIASDQVAPKTYANSAGTFVLNASLTTVVTESAPAGAVGFILEAKDSNAANIRWALGATATTTSGMQLQPGRDTGYVPAGANLSVVAESGTLEYQLTWVKQ